MPEQDKQSACTQSDDKIRFNRNELAGAFGDMGTDVPLLIGVIIASGLDASSVLIMFGLMQIFSGIVYRMPVPVQPLKAIAAMVISHQIAPSLIYGAGIAIGIIMLLFTVSGLLDWLARAIPKCVVRGIQFGLGLQLAVVALGKYAQSDGIQGITLAVISFLITLALLNNRKLPAAIPVVLLGITYAFIFKLDLNTLTDNVGICLPKPVNIKFADVLTGFLLLSVPQIPLSIGNSILATAQLGKDLFPHRELSIKKLGFTYSLMNLITPWLGGFPLCHGSSGLVGHYTFGGRTGGSVIIYGSIFIIIGFLFGNFFSSIFSVFPLPVLGVLLLFEASGLIYLCRDVASNKYEFPITIIVGLIAFELPYGFVIGMVAGTAMAYLRDKIYPGAE